MQRLLCSSGRRIALVALAQLTSGRDGVSVASSRSSFSAMAMMPVGYEAARQRSTLRSVEADGARWPLTQPLTDASIGADIMGRSNRVESHHQRRRLAVPSYAPPLHDSIQGLPAASMDR